MKKILLLSAFLLQTALTFAQKEIYLPMEWRGNSSTYLESDPNNTAQYSKSRSRESENYIVFWEKGYGNTAPDQLPKNDTYYVDIDDLLAKAESFYKLNVETLGFANTPESSVNKYKGIICIVHQAEWLATGSGYDFMIPALWVNPSTCKPVGHTIAHEIGHSFQYMCFSDANNHQNSSTVNTGFHLPCGSGQAIWEQTAQWQGAQAYPNQMFSQSIGTFRASHNYAFSHEWHRYQSYWLHYYICQYYDDIQTVAKVWQQPMTGATDFNDALMALKNLSVEDLYRLYFDYASHCATWDFEACEPYRAAFIGDFNYNCVCLSDGSYQVALSSCPQSTGFNVIPLQVPEAGTEVTTHFTALRDGSALAEGDPAEYLNGDGIMEKSGRSTYVRSGVGSTRGFRLGYVALMKDGTRKYFSEDKVYCTGSGEKSDDVSFTVPEGVDQMWLIVSPALTKYYRHKWDDNFTVGDDMWPYKFSLEGTDIGNHATLYVPPTLDGRSISDVKFNIDYYVPYSATSYEGELFTINGKTAAMMGTAFQMDPSFFPEKIVNYSASGPAAGKIMFYAANSSGSLINASPTATGYGYWFNANGQVTDWNNGFVYAEFYPSLMTFYVGQYPGKSSVGKEYTIAEAFRYRNTDNQYAIATFVLNVHITDGRAGAILSSIEYDDPTGLINEELRMNNEEFSDDIYDLSGRKLKNLKTQELKNLHPGLYIVGGKKVLVK
jgi:hypothetical protein